MKKAPLSVARRYARALLDVALEQNAAEPLEDALHGAADLFAAQAELRRVLTHPALSPEKKKKVATAIWAETPALLQRFVALLIDRDRAAILPAVHAAYVNLLNDHRGVVAVDAISATPLGENHVQALAAAAKTLAGREVHLTMAVDPALLGGVLLRMSGRTYDGSLRAQLRALRLRLAPGSTSSFSSPRI